MIEAGLAGLFVPRRAEASATLARREHKALGRIVTEACLRND